eukprot:CAMPEP_0204151822 /NCGR_PEP_ID=MMETSP0361-20130328/26490_1 /ASSEMBLY_ACC=CAM_ASM_000343 /TAXON_ID=268821 /ORGANISM="Scrippsiella Hangoei, Strain SHTV-5" /LENGTH=188 /DNA_ID=CAMNT_0051106685 /DNA_START=48 /DNA_END=611 /DNA_ORIENTATION=+
MMLAGPVSALAVSSALRRGRGALAVLAAQRLPRRNATVLVCDDDAAGVAVTPARRPQTASHASADATVGGRRRSKSDGGRTHAHADFATAAAASGPGHTSSASEGKLSDFPKRLDVAGGVPVHLYTDDIDEDTKMQLINLARSGMPVGFVAAMPDVHLGKGATIGSVFASRDYVCPNAVGVDIGCGMC